MRRRLPTHVAWPALVVIGSIALAGCFTTSADYQRDAEEFIIEDESLSEALFPTDPPPASGATRFTSATCEDPESQDVGTTFICTAEDDAGGDWEFEVEIQDANAYDINVSRRPV
jgi:hypothetical protein